MDILTDYRITSLLASERELAQHVERIRIADERAQQPVARTTTGSLVCVPMTSH